ncbi:alpha/beta hydrolase [Paracoccus homiensis]|uniref:alpha/beta hydrolase n=1 Tax=Paracoccus homiensis TaxID=364199 RepID=UPI00398C8B00
MSALSRRLFLAAGLGLCAPRVLGRTPDRDRDFIVSDGHSDWRVLLSLPRAAPPPQGYSLIVALDGARMQPMLRDLRDKLVPDAPVALAGITYPAGGRRWLDLTSPAKVLLNPPPGTWRAPDDRQTGGRGIFLAMLRQNLFPRLLQEAPVNAAQATLYGHSLGGLFVFHALFNDPTLFARYVAADPSTWWNAGEVVSEARAFAGGVRGAGQILSPPRGLMLLRARAMAQGGRVGPVMIDTALTTALSGIGGLHLDYDLMPEEDHGSIIAPSLVRTLNWHLARSG